jgi:hypothetical protein
MRQVWDVQPRADGPCIFCGNTSLHGLEADEGLIRQAVLTDAEILTFDGMRFRALPEPLVCFAIEKRQPCHEISSAGDIIEGSTSAALEIVPTNHWNTFCLSG